MDESIPKTLLFGPFKNEKSGQVWAKPRLSTWDVVGLTHTAGLLRHPCSSHSKAEAHCSGHQPIQLKPGMAVIGRRKTGHEEPTDHGRYKALLGSQLAQRAGPGTS